jgi:maltooligosyltrehalose trehalohydrolase
LPFRTVNRGFFYSIEDLVADGKRWTHGPSFERGGIRFRLWAPAQERVDLELTKTSDVVPMERRGDGFFEAFVGGAGAGALYRFVLSDGMRVPDPASRLQPQDVHGPSETADPDAYVWSEKWGGLNWDDAVLYELHLGAFTREGTYDGAAQRLDHLAELGVTAIELMPVAAFSGRWDWGYDGVYLYAPDASYGRPERFKAFVEAAHARGIAVLLDVVYNHFGPEGNYMRRYAPDFFTSRHKTPWGDAINFDGPIASPVRAFVIENALYWLDEFRLDGLRLDAVHAIKDDSSPDILEELADRVRSRFNRPVHLLLENLDNEPGRLKRRGANPLFYTAQWNDDLHHVLHVAATGQSTGYYVDYGETRHLSRALAEGFAYQGEHSRHLGHRRGGPSADLPPSAFVAFTQNHDQIGNRRFGERLNALAPPVVIRALASVYLLLPQVPMIFMGEEWGALQPFLFFCDFEGDLAAAVREGRRREFADFHEFPAPEGAADIPDPLAEETFLASKLDWSEAVGQGLAFYREALAARREHVRPLLPAIARGGEAVALGEQAVRATWAAGARRLVLDANLSGDRAVFPQIPGRVFWRCGEWNDSGQAGPWGVRWSVETP